VTNIYFLARIVQEQKLKRRSFIGASLILKGGKSMIVTSPSKETSRLHHSENTDYILFPEERMLKKRKCCPCAIL